jgi:phosphoribosylanthranilate isomerase
MFRVKICGITRAEDGLMAVEAGADAIGLNFYPQSPRCVTVDCARQIAAAIGRRACVVGVFVNASAWDIREMARRVPLDAVQLSGDEAPELLRELCPIPVVRAVRAGLDLAEIATQLDACHRLRAMPRMLLADAHRGGQYGGTGTTLDWELLAAGRQLLRGVPLALAGGLTPDNVAAAIGVVHPWAVDVASGVESSPGVKSPKLVEHFVTAAHQAFARQNRRRV